jgi:zinc protease
MTSRGLRSAPRQVAVLLAFAVCAASPFTSFGEQPANLKPVSAIEGITEYRLSNGFRILLFPDSSTPKVTINLTVFVGSRHEGYGETGMAHLLEHMVFKGTPTHRQIPKDFRDRGAEFNGTTWVDRTNYYEILPAGDDNLEFAIRLEADRLVNSLILREDLASEMTVVRNEFEQGENSPEGILSQRMLAAAYEWHNYGKNTIGNRSDIERVPVDRLRVFYKKHYQPDNAMLIVAGNFKPAKALSLAADSFGRLPKPTRFLDETYTEEPPQDGERSVVLRRVGRVGAVGAVYHIPAAAHADFAAVEVLASILDDEPSGRLYKALVESHKATKVDATAFGWHDPGALEVGATVDLAHVPEAALSGLVATLDEVAQKGVSTEEVNRAKQKLRKQRTLQMTNSTRVGVTLSEWASKGDWRLFFVHRDRVARVTPADVQRVARLYLQTSNRTTGLFLPAKEPMRAQIPATPDVVQMMKDYTGAKTLAAGEKLDPDLETLAKHVEFSTLSCGVKAAVLPHRTRGETVTLHLTLNYGNPASLRGNAPATQFLGTLMARGTRHHSRQELHDELDRLEAQLVPSGTVGEIDFDITCKRANLPSVLQLLKEILHEPTFPEKEFEVLKRAQHSRLEEEKTDPHRVVFRTMQRKLSSYPPDDVRYVPTVEESLTRLEATTLDHVRRLWSEQLGGQHGELVVVGDCDAAAVLEQVDAALKDWKAAVPYKRIERPAPSDMKGGRVVLEVPDKSSAVYAAAVLLPMQDTHSDNAALEVASFLLGGGSLSSRLGDRVRQKEGLSYGIGSQFSADSLDPSARFFIFAICNPKNIGKVDTVVLDELEKMRKAGVADRELEEGRKAFLAMLRQERSGDREIAALLAEELHAGRSALTYQVELEKKIATLSVAEVNEAFRKHIDPRKLVIIHAGDFRKN